MPYWHVGKRWGGHRPCETAALARGRAGVGLGAAKESSPPATLVWVGGRGMNALRPDLCRRLTALDRGGKRKRGSSPRWRPGLEDDRFQGLTEARSPSPSLGLSCRSLPRAPLGLWEWLGVAHPSLSEPDQLPEFSLAFLLLLCASPRKSRSWVQQVRYSPRSQVAPCRNHAARLACLTVWCRPADHRTAGPQGLEERGL